MGEFIAEGTVGQSYIGPADSETLVALRGHPMMRGPLQQLFSYLTPRRHRMPPMMYSLRLRITWPPEFPPVQTEGGTR